MRPLIRRVHAASGWGVQRVVPADAFQELVEVGAGELPVEWPGGCVVVPFEGEDLVGQAVEVAEVVGREQLALDDGEVEPRRVTPARCRAGVPSEPAVPVFRAARLKQALMAAGRAEVPGWCRSRCGCGSGVYEVVCDTFVRRAEVHHGVDRVLADRLARGGVALLPFLRALGLVVGVQEQSPAERAPAALAAQQVPGRGSTGRRSRRRRCCQ